MNETIKCLTERRTIRQYKKEQISDEQLDMILRAGQYAPSGMGAQASKMVVVQDKETIAQLSKMNATVMGKDIDPFHGAPTVIVVLADPERGTYIEDGSVVIANLMNAAHSVGVGSCWVHRARQVFSSEEGKKLLEKWGIDRKYEGIGHCVLGYVDGDYPEAKPRKEDYVTYIR
jgi:nitroreductase